MATAWVDDKTGPGQWFAWICFGDCFGERKDEIGKQECDAVR